jgi:hypothetical protein
MPLTQPDRDAGAPSGWAEDVSGMPPTMPLRSPSRDAGEPSGWAEGAGDVTEPSGPPMEGTGEDWPSGYAEFDEDALRQMPEEQRVQKMMHHLRRYFDLGKKVMGENPATEPGRKIVAMMGRLRRHAEPTRPGLPPGMPPPGKNPADAADDYEDPTMPVRPPVAAAGERLPTKTTVTHHYSERQVKGLIDQAVHAALKQYGGRLKQLQRFAEQHTAAEKKRAVRDVCDRLQREGKLTPSERPAVQARLTRADARQPLQRFKEKRTGRVRDLTEFDLQVIELERRPSYFAERFKDPVRVRIANGGGDKGGNLSDWDHDRLDRFWERHGESFEKAGTGRAEFVRVFTAASPAERESLLKNGDGR